MGLVENETPEYVWVVCSKQHEALYVAEDEEFVTRYAAKKIGKEWDGLIKQGYYVEKYEKVVKREG